MKKVPYLETSPAMYQRKGGSGSCNTGFPTPTGSRTAAILQAPKDSSSPTETPSNTRSDVTWGEAFAEELEEMAAKEYNAFTRAANLTRKSWSELDEQIRRFHMTAMMKRLESGEHGVNDSELLQFWQTRIPVRQKG